MLYFFLTSKLLDAVRTSDRQGLITRLLTPHLWTAWVMSRWGGLITGTSHPPALLSDLLHNYCLEPLHGWMDGLMSRTLMGVNFFHIPECWLPLNSSLHAMYSSVPMRLIFLPRYILTLSEYSYFLRSTLVILYWLSLDSPGLWVRQVIKQNHLYFLLWWPPTLHLSDSGQTDYERVITTFSPDSIKERKRNTMSN